VLKVNVDFAHNVDCSGRHETPAGIAGLGRPRRRKARALKKSLASVQLKVDFINPSTAFYFIIVVIRLYRWYPNDSLSKFIQS
jgi:hypothetical protein